MVAGESAETARSRRWARVSAFLAAACVAVVLAPQAFADPGVYVVNSNSGTPYDSCTANGCTLADAITAANTDGLPSTIDFSLTFPQTEIDLASALPAVTAPVTIDGTSVSISH